MTLFLLVTTIAAVLPFVAIGSQASMLSWSALVVGTTVPVVLGVLQFVGHHRIVARISAKESVAGISAATVVAVYYVAIFVGGMISAALAQYVARAW